MQQQNKARVEKKTNYTCRQCDLAMCFILCHEIVYRTLVCMLDKCKSPSKEVKFAWITSTMFKLATQADIVHAIIGIPKWYVLREKEETRLCWYFMESENDHKAN